MRLMKIAQQVIDRGLPMSQQQPESLGILNLERGLPRGTDPVDPRPGHLFYPGTFDFPIVSETVEGAWAENVIRGDPSLEAAYIAAAKRLVNRGAIAISANCGFTIRHQKAIAEAVDVPVATSSLLLLPVLLRQLPPTGKVAIITADSQCLGVDLLEIDDPADIERVVIGGVEGGRLWQNEMRRPPPRTTPADIESDVLECVRRILEKHSGISALLFECTAFPTVSSSIRRATGFPVYDITSLCRLTYWSARSSD